jgi:hypothetical protein
MVASYRIGDAKSALEYKSADEMRGAAEGFAHFGQDAVARLLLDALATAYPDG